MITKYLNEGINYGLQPDVGWQATLIAQRSKMDKIHKCDINEQNNEEKRHHSAQRSEINFNNNSGGKKTIKDRNVVDFTHTLRDQSEDNNCI